MAARRTENARLAARLTGYKVDIRSESQDLGIDPDADEEEAPPAAADTATASSAQIRIHAKGRRACRLPQGRSAGDFIRRPNR